MVTSVLASRFKTLRDGLRRELVNRGHQVTHYFESMDGLPLALNFQNSADDTITVYWGPKSNRHRMVDPDSRSLADAIIKTIESDMQPPQPITINRPQQKPPQSKPQQSKPQSKPQGGVFITDEEYEELQKLRAMAAHGVWLSHEVYEAMQKEMRAGYIPPEARRDILAQMDALIRRMTYETGV